CVDSKASVGRGDGQAGVRARNLAKRRSRLFFEVFYVLIVCPKLAAQLLPREELRGQVLLHDHESAVRNQRVKVERQGRTLQGPECTHIDGNGGSQHRVKKFLA